LNCFRKAIIQFGIHHHTRCDKDSGNIRVTEMIRLRCGEDSRPAMASKSTQTTRIERIWRDYNEKVVRKFEPIFLGLDARRQLSNCTNHDDMGLVNSPCSTRVFLHRIRAVEYRADVGCDDNAADAYLELRHVVLLEALEATARSPRVPGMSRAI
jgi:hypothetical protein